MRAALVLCGLLLTATSWPAVLAYGVTIGALVGWKNLGGQGL